MNEEVSIAILLEVAIIDAGDDTIKVVHQFYGLTKREVETYKREHLGTCSYFGSAEREGRTLETLERIDESDLPEAADYEEEEEEEEIE